MTQETIKGLREWHAKEAMAWTTVRSSDEPGYCERMAEFHARAYQALASDPPPFRGEGDNLRLLRCIHSAMGCLDAVSGGVDQRLGWLRLLDAVEGREPRGTREFSALERPEDLVQRARLRLRDGPPIEGFDHANDVVMIHKLCALIAAPPALVTPGEDHYPAHEALSQLVRLQDEYDALNGGGPNWLARFNLAMAEARDLVRVEP